MNLRPTQRVEAIDIVRGVIMILMALDHTRDFFGDARVSPTNLATTNEALFFTRWVTHFCAPTFFLLTGASAYRTRGRRSTGNLSRFLLTRGLWLVVLELTIARLLWQFNVDYKVTLLNVLWALGWAMVALAAFVHLPTRVIAIAGALMVVMHNIFDGVPAAAFGALAPLWTVLHSPGFLVSGPHTVFVAYPLIPWIGVTAIGYALGSLWDMPAERRGALLLRLGVGCIAAFIVMRALNIYGDPTPFTPQPRNGLTLVSFLNLNKYPPSLLFLLMTLGPVFLALRALDTRTPAWLGPARTIGTVPMFYYLMHVLLLHIVVVALSLARFGTARPTFDSPTLDRFPITQVPGWPVSLPIVYLIWIAVVIALYPLCRWYMGVKRQRSNPWLSYL